MLSDARKSTNRVKNGGIKEFFSEIVHGCSYEERVIHDIEHSKNQGKGKENHKNLVND